MNGDGDTSRWVLQAWILISPIAQNSNMICWNALKHANCTYLDILDACLSMLIDAYRCLWMLLENVVSCLHCDLESLLHSFSGMDAPLAVLNAAPVQGCRGSVFNFKNNVMSRISLSNSGWSCSKFHICTLHWWILALYITSLCRFLWWNLNCVVFFVDGVWHGVDDLLMVLVKFLATSCNIYIKHIVTLISFSVVAAAVVFE